ncbi:hypothetical protein [Nocardioides bruguierae]|uniref:hypothetical protein n=1 Tax=Nocardioides bruguierae TaxID=2945102 RepID=UPI002021BCBB|nr:hypothetical protein [Nocardioides bruguierae]MCL8025026.1 hypothetical protein [Nocardioides bruguierae]
MPAPRPTPSAPAPARARARRWTVPACAGLTALLAGGGALAAVAAFGAARGEPVGAPAVTPAAATSGAATSVAALAEPATAPTAARPTRVLRWAPCVAPAVLEQGVCVTDVTVTVVLPARQDEAPDRSSQPDLAWATPEPVGVIEAADAREPDLAWGSDPTPSPTASTTPGPTPGPTPSPTPTASASPSASPTESPTESPTVAPTESASVTSTP